DRGSPGVVRRSGDPNTSMRSENNGQEDNPAGRDVCRRDRRSVGDRGRWDGSERLRGGNQRCGGEGTPWLPVRGGVHLRRRRLGGQAAGAHVLVVRAAQVLRGVRDARDGQQPDAGSYKELCYGACATNCIDTRSAPAIEFPNLTPFNSVELAA